MGRALKRIPVILACALMLMLCAAAFAEAFEITDISVARNGDLKVEWTDPEGNAPYKVLFQPISAVNEQAPTGDIMVWCNSGEVTETEYTESYVTADASWWFIVQDSAGRQTAARYDGQAHEYDEACSVELSGRSQKLVINANSHDFEDTGDDYAFMIRLDTDKILAADGNTWYGITVRMSLSGGSDCVAYHLKFAVYAAAAGWYAEADMPMVVYVTDDTSTPLVLNDSHPAQEYFVPLSPFVERMADRYGADEITGSVVMLKVYFDGGLVGELPFRLR